MAQEKPPQIICAENISLLLLLHEVPIQPKSNPPKSLPALKTYSLPFEKERGLASTLAFLASIRDDSSHIPAVCIGEASDSSRLNIFLAVNRTESSDGNAILHDTQRGFEQLFLILARAFDGQHDISKTESEVFTAIVSMCSQRILSRFRLLGGAKRSYKNIKEGLLEVISVTNRLQNNSNNTPSIVYTISSFVTAAREVIKYVDTWYNHRTLLRMEDLVESVYRLHQSGTVHTVLRRLLTNRDMNPSLRASLENMIKKVARYREAARYLFRTAKKFPIVRQAKVSPVNLPQEAFQSFPFDQYEPQLLSAISRTAPQYAKAKNRNQIWRLLQMSESGASNKFSERTRKTLQEAKIHAEIQLIFYCELQSSIKLPRVLSSSKDACYMCSEFISMYGKMYTPRCHGRLYPGWKLPFLPQIDGVQQEFNQNLENKIRYSLDIMMSRKERTNYPQPIESTLLTLPASISTLKSLSVSGAKPIGIESSDHRPSKEDISSTISSAISHFGAQADSTKAECATRSMSEPSDKDISESDRLTSKGSLLNSNHIRNNSYPLSQGTTLIKRIQIPHKLSPLYTTGPLEVQIEYDIDSNETPTSQNELPYSIEWLTMEDVDTKERCHSRCVVDAECLDGEILHEMCNDNNLYIAARGSVLRLTFH